MNVTMSEFVRMREITVFGLFLPLFVVLAIAGADSNAAESKSLVVVSSGSQKESKANTQSISISTFSDKAQIAPSSQSDAIPSADEPARVFWDKDATDGGYSDSVSRDESKKSGVSVKFAMNEINESATNKTQTASFNSVMKPKSISLEDSVGSILKPKTSASTNKPQPAVVFEEQEKIIPLPKVASDLDSRHLPNRKAIDSFVGDDVVRKIPNVIEDDLKPEVFDKEEIILAQRGGSRGARGGFTSSGSVFGSGFFGGFDSESSSEPPRKYVNSETKPFTPPKKSENISSDFKLLTDDLQALVAAKGIVQSDISNPAPTDSEASENEPQTDIESTVSYMPDEDDDNEFPQLDLDGSTPEPTDMQPENILNEDVEESEVVEKTEPETIQVDVNDIKVSIDPSNVGNPYSAQLIGMMHEEIMNGLKDRGVTSRYEMFRNYARSTLNKFAGLNTKNEVDGRYRLSWYEKLYRDPVKSVYEVEEFSRSLHAGLKGDHRYLAETLKMVREKLDVKPRNDEIRFARAETPKQAVAEVQRCLVDAQKAYARAISTLTPAEQRDLASNLDPTFAENCVNGHTVPARSVGRRLVAILQKMDRTGIHESLESLVPLTDEKFLRLLATLPEDTFPTVSLGGQRVQRVATPAGDILIGGRGNNVYDLDAPGMQDVVCVIDLGGNDTYKDGTCNINRPVFIIIDLAGDDKYVSNKTGVQGGSVLGVSMLLDLSGNDEYSAKNVAQGSTLGGAGLLIDYSGDDSYKALKRGQGTALGGVGIIIDRAGDDKYRAALIAQGLGHPGGFGVLEDSDGNDKYYVGGLFEDFYPEHPGYDGWGQGIGAGIRQVANGGVGALLDGGGDDTYEYDYFSHGGGYWLGIGFARDFGGNDKRLGATLMDYYGNQRSQSRWQRFSCGFGCHYAIGYCFDDEGDDTYGGTIMGSGMAWDLAVGFLCDLSGNDRFEATGGLTQGAGAEGGFGVLFNYDGNDVYLGKSQTNQGYANPMISYHSPSDCGANFSFLIDYGGRDDYACRVGNNVYVQRGGSGGYLIDRPFDVEEVADRIAAEKAAVEKAELQKKAAEEQAAAQKKAAEDRAAAQKKAAERLQQQRQQQQQQYRSYR